MNVWTQQLKALNNQSTARLLKNNKFYFDANGQIQTTDPTDYDPVTFQLRDPASIFNDYKKREDTIDTMQYLLNRAGARDAENRELKLDRQFGPRTQSAWNQFAETNLPEEENKLRDALPKAADAVKGMVPSTTFIDPLQTKISGVVYKGRELTKEGTPVYKLYDEATHQRLFQIDQHTLNHIPNQPHLNVEVPKGSSHLQKSLSKKLNHKVIPEQAYKTFHNFDNVIDTVKKGGKAIAVAGAALDIADLGGTIYDDLTDEDKKLGKKTVSAVAGMGGSWAGATVGAKAGAMGGAAIGSFILPGLGTVIGGFIGGLAGGILGSFAGQAIGENIVDAVF